MRVINRVTVLSTDVFDLSLSDSCLQENEETTENGINPELAKVCVKDRSVFFLYLNLVTTTRT